jgi:hypothetical protein
MRYLCKIRYCEVDTGCNSRVVDCPIDFKVSLVGIVLIHRVVNLLQLWSRFATQEPLNLLRLLVLLLKSLPTHRCCVKLSLIWLVQCLVHFSAELLSEVRLGRSSVLRCCSWTNLRWVQEGASSTSFSFCGLLLDLEVDLVLLGSFMMERVV